MNDGLWYCRECKTVRAGPEHRPPDEPCPVCDADPDGGNLYARAGP